MKTIAVLFCREDSIYKSIPCCDCYDKARNALTYTGNDPVIAHPPCRAWGRMRHTAKPVRGERRTALFAVDTVRRNGGVLEHPAGSTLWEKARMPRPGKGVDDYGGYSIEIAQYHFGHRAEKRTWLYIVGCPPSQLPFFLPKLGNATHVIARSTRHDRPHVTHREREATPEQFARWLCAVARRTKVTDA